MYVNISGVGKKMVVTPVSIVICLYFKKYLAITMGIVTAAYAGSRLLMSPLIQLILQEYGFRGLLLIVGGLTLNMSLGASLFQPVNWHSRLVPVEVEIKNHDANGRVNPEEKNIIVGDKNDNCPTSDIQCVSLTSKIPAEHKSEMVTLMKETKFKMETTEISCNSVVHNRQMSINLASSWDIFAELGMEPCKDCDKYRDATNKKKRRWSFRDALLKSIDLTLLKEGVFYVICFDSALMTTTAIYMSIYIFHAGIELGLYPMQAAGLASTRAFGEMSGRLIGPLLITILKLKIAPTYIVCLFLHGITLISK